MEDHPWIQEFSGAITVCDAEGIILEMNDKSVEIYKKEGGNKLIGSNVLDCHPELARTKLKLLMDTRKTNIYTIEKNGVKKLIYQSPWYRDGQYGGFVELSFEIPFPMPHFVRED